MTTPPAFLSARDAKSHARLLAALAVACALGCTGMARAGGKTLSDSADFGGREFDAAKALKSRDEATVFWGAGTLLAATTGKEAAAAARAMARRKGSFADAAFLLAVHRNDSAIAALSATNDPEDSALAAAATALWSLDNHLSEMNAPETPPKGTGLVGKGKKAGGGADAAVRSTPAPDAAPWLASKDPSTQYHALLACAYARNKEVRDTVTGLPDTAPRVAAAKRLYLAMTGAEADAAGILKAAQQAAKAAAPAPPASPASGIRISASLEVPPLALLCEAIAEWRLAEGLPVLERALKDPSVVTQVSAARALRSLKGVQVEPLLSQALPACAWPTLVEICAAAGERPDASLIPALLARLAREKGRMRLDLVHALSCIAGEQKANDAAGWTKWWEENKAVFKVDRAASTAFRAKVRVQDVSVPQWGMFYQLGIFSDRFCYVVDSSQSMKGARLASLKQNLETSTGALPAHVRFNLVDFGGDVEILDGSGLTSKTRAVRDHVYEMDMSLGTRVFCALRQGMLVPEVDTIYLLTDGAPAKDSVKSWGEVSRGLSLLTRHCPVALYCVDFDPTETNKAAMRRLVGRNHGRQESIDVDKDAPAPANGRQ